MNFKRFLITLTLLLLTTSAWATAPDFYANYWLNNNSGRYLGGEHTPLIWTGTVYLPKASVVEQTTAWIQYGYSPDATMAGGNVEFYANPEIFTLTLWLDSYPTNAAGDSAILVAARFEYADSINAVIPFWDADSINLFLQDGRFTHPLYNAWVYEDIPRTLGTTVDNKRWVYMLRVTRPGGCMRLVFTGAVSMDDSTRVRWELRGEH